MNFYNDEELDEDVGGLSQPENDGGQNGGGVGQKLRDKGAEMAKDKMKDKAKEKLAKDAAKKAAAKGSLGAAMGPVLFWAGIIILAIIVIIGIIMFFITMPGMVMEKLKALGKAIADGLSSWFGSDDTERIEEESIYGSLNYLEEMGYDLKGYGFLTDYMTQEDLDAMDEDEKENGAILDEDVGVIRDNDEKIIKASSDYITAYLISDNYVYTIANHNLVTGGSDTPWYQWLWDRVQAIGRHLADFFGGSLGEKWTRGLIAIYEEKDGVIGKRGAFYSDTGFLNFDDLRIDPASRTLTIEKSGFWNSNQAMKYNLDGWTGRYGMPIDFLISVHAATMMPDLAYDMSVSFETQINLLLHPVEAANVQAAFLNNGEYIFLEEFREIYDAGWLDFDHISNEDAMRILKELQLPASENCTKNPTCDVSEDRKACDECKKYLKEIRDCLKASIDKDFDFYIPYIESVEDHWYRNVYFVTMKNVDFVTSDYDYEAVMRERWTLYEVDENGEFKLYVISDDGEYATTDYKSEIERIFEEKENAATDEAKRRELEEKHADFLDRLIDDNGLLRFKGKKEETANEGFQVAKKAVIKQYSDTEEFKEYLEDLSWQLSEESSDGGIGLWTAYAGITDEVARPWEAAFPEDSDQAKSGIYTRITTNPGTTMKQVGEGQRSETNTTIKKMFLQNTYFRYDGNLKTAENIMKIRDAIRNDVTKKGVIYGPLNELQIDEDTYNDYTDKILTPAGTFINAYDSDGKPIAIPEENADKYYKVSDYSGQVTLNQDSLNAFSMLENTHTLDSDYIYRDFKELIVELGYFEKEELTDETPKLLQFFVPELDSIGYPDRTIDKRENEYGTMSHSYRDMIANSKNTLIATTEEATKKEEIVTQGTENPEIERRLLSLEAWWDECDRMMKEFEANNWSYQQAHDSETRGSFEKAKASGGYYTDCSEFASWALQKLGVLDEGDIFTSNLATSRGIDENDEVGKKIVEASKEIILFGGSPIHDARLLRPGDVIFYDGHVSIFYGAGKCFDAGSAYWSYTEEPVRYGELLSRPCNCVVRFELGVKQYRGYFGNEAVVSPVTGVLLEYGTYNPKDNQAIKHIDSITGDEYRVNVDLKYGPVAGNVGATTTDSTGNPTTLVEPFESQIVSDSVGYAKILVLDQESYQILESTTQNQWQTDSLLTENGKFKNPLVNDDDSTAKEKLKDLSELDRTIYGYKEFAELYSQFGISGYIIYIDGFSCEIPDYELRHVDPREMYKELPNGTAINLDYFQEITESNIEDISEDDRPRSYYLPEELYKLASQDATDKLAVEIGAKRFASSTIYTNDMIFIKEGTILGRTITDRELIEEVRENEHGEFEEYRPEKIATLKPETEPRDKVVGNYLRIIMRELDGTPVENVEDYMKLRKAMRYNDYDTSDPELFVTKEEFTVMFAGRENIMDNIDSFMDIQSKYGVSGVFGASVTLTESAGGTAWDLIDPSTYNWVSIKGGNVEDGTGWMDRQGTVWRNYNSFAEAIDHFGRLIAYSPHYYTKDNIWVSQIGPIYCDEEWIGKTFRHMRRAYDKLYVTDY